MKRARPTLTTRTLIGYLCGFIVILLLSGSAGAVVPFGGLGLDTDAEPGDGFGSVLARGDFNSDGYHDLAVGLPYEDLIAGKTSIVDAGAVEVIYGSAPSLTSVNRQFLRQGGNGIEDVAEVADNFGCSLAAADFNGDFFDDLAIGACREDIGAIVDAGAVHVIYGSPQGLSAAAAIPDQFWHQSLDYCVKRVTAGRGWTLPYLPCVLGDMAEPGDGFGWALAASSRVLVIGIPYEDVGSIPDAGAINVLHGSSAYRPGEGLHEESWQLPFVHQDSAGIPDDAEPYDRFGYSLAVGEHHILVIGVPWEDVGSIPDAGAVTVIYEYPDTLVTDSTTQFWDQNALGMFTDGVEAGDLFGLALAVGNFNGWDAEPEGNDLAIGVPREDVNGIRDAGAVNVIYGHGHNTSVRLTAADSQFWHQDSPGILDSAEPYDLFGYSLAVGDFDGNARDDLAIGVPYEDISGVGDAGAVAVIYAANTVGLRAEFSDTPPQFWHQNISNIADTAENLDRFGFSLAAGYFHYGGAWSLAIGVPYEAVSGVAGAGGVAVIYGSNSNLLFGGLSATVTPDQLWTQTPSQILPPITF